MGWLREMIQIDLANIFGSTAHLQGDCRWDIGKSSRPKDDMMGGLWFDSTDFDLEIPMSC